MEASQQCLGLKFTLIWTNKFRISLYILKNKSAGLGNRQASFQTENPAHLWLSAVEAEWRMFEGISQFCAGSWTTYLQCRSKTSLESCMGHLGYMHNSAISPPCLIWKWPQISLEEWWGCRSFLTSLIYAIVKGTHWGEPKPQSFVNIASDCLP